MTDILTRLLRACAIGAKADVRLSARDFAF